MCKICWDKYRLDSAKSYAYCEICNKRFFTTYNIGKLCRKCKEKELGHTPKQFTCIVYGKIVYHKNKYNMCYDCYKKSDIPKKIGRENWAKAGSWTFKRSKNEIYFASLCADKYNISTNDVRFNGWDADIILNDFNIAIEWNGIWHYEKLFDSYNLNEKQNRDLIKAKEIKNAGYTLYIIKDLGRENKEFVEKEFKKFEKYMIHMHI